MRGLHEFKLPLFGRGEENIESFDLSVQAKFLELGENPFRVVFVVWRSDMVRTRGEPLHVGAYVGGLGDSAELGFQIPLVPRGVGGVTAQRPDFGGLRERGNQKRTE